MTATPAEIRQRAKHLSRTELETLQLERLNQLLATTLPTNTFYAQKLDGIELPLRSLDDLKRLPLTTKEELIEGVDESGVGPHRTYPIEQYTRMHRTSGTQGQAITILDTSEDWQWWVDTWQFVLDAAEITNRDRALMAFSFGPFIGFWSAYDALVARGALVIPAGGLTTLARLDLLRQSGATCVCCTPTYAMRMAQVAADSHFPLAACDVEKIIVAGEPGGSIPAVRDRIETSWNARVYDHSGATEIGPWGFPDVQRTGLHIAETEFIAEFIDQHTGEEASIGSLSELVLTPLGRCGMPLIRYRTGDLVYPVWSHSPDDCRFVLLESGVLGRTDDMVIIRGVNVFPSSIEEIIRSFPEIDEFRVTVRRREEMDELSIEVEDQAEQPERITRELQLRLGLRIDVTAVPVGTLPRYEAKSRRFVDERPREIRRA
ncbi:MAG: phenylacetate--CoA ligase family protein [Planctomycetales bacterium]|nr:phenylacetate--CoA ligase family protein [Planctomycetales bacterium]